MAHPPQFTVLEPITNTSLKAELIAVYNSGDSVSTFRFRFRDTRLKFETGMVLLMQNDTDNLFLMEITGIEFRHHDDATDLIVQRMSRLLNFVERLEAQNVKLLGSVRYDL